MKTATILVLVAFIAMGMTTACALHSPKKKPGTCPEMLTEDCDYFIDRCSGDESCPNEDKCCKRGCGHICLSPEFTHFKVSIILGLLFYCCDKTLTKGA
uniref:WAP domain-containing protein n=1 Tax=Mus spicilegus TaxID=10103 RepID=A0A8C6H1M6_MUSSI